MLMIINPIAKVLSHYESKIFNGFIVPRFSIKASSCQVMILQEFVNLSRHAPSDIGFFVGAEGEKFISLPSQYTQILVGKLVPKFS